MSSANDASASWSEVPASALPPYFTTTVLPAKRRMYGSASTSVAAFEAAAARRVPASRSVLTGRGRSSTSPAVSSRPSATLAACTAPPDAPLVRLSIAHMAIDRAGALVEAGETCAAFDPSTDLVAGGSAVTATNGSSA